MNPPIYATLAELKAAYDSGELNRETTWLYIDNDQTSVYTDTGQGSSKVFEGGTPTALLEQALTLLGIPWDNV